MLLSLDVGNTNITIGCCNGGYLNRTWRLSIDQTATPDEIDLKVQSLFVTLGIEPEQIDNATISCVVPYLNRSLTVGLERYLDLSPTFLKPVGNDLVGLHPGTAATSPAYPLSKNSCRTITRPFHMNDTYWSNKQSGES